MTEHLLLLKYLLEPQKNKIYKYITSISKNVYIDRKDDIVDKYNYTYHAIIKIKPLNLTSSTHVDCGKENNDKGPKFEVGQRVRISKSKNNFA